MTDRLHVLGIRHHGPGSASSVERALAELDPEVVLIEGPNEASELIPFAAAPGMQPPLALLIYPKGYPQAARFFPFAEFSPEWCAMVWAIKNKRVVEFIDLPTQSSVVEALEAEQRLEEVEQSVQSEHDEEDEADAAEPDVGDLAELDDLEESVSTIDPLADDPVAVDPLDELAQLAGHSDGERWWNGIVEQSEHSVDAFAAIDTLMAELRAQREERKSSEQIAHIGETREQLREAFMRQRIRNALKKHEGQVAVVCGAWHTPALSCVDNYTIKDDRELLKEAKPAKCESCWIPWTDQRLAMSSGYRAGIVSPGWYRHLWRQKNNKDSVDADIARWQSEVAGLLRNEGYDASTASVIEATRLTRSLAAIRGLSVPGLTEMQDASLSALCHGELAPLKVVDDKLIIGNRVGRVDDSVPQPALLADLAKLQSKHRLKPEALGREIKFDLRSASGMAKSELLHRLSLLNVPWGVMTDAEAGRGTFREVWFIQWQPEHAVALSEAVVYGPTVEIAAAACAVSKAEEIDNAQHLAKHIKNCLLANLPQAVAVSIARLQAMASTSVEISSLMSIVPPLADTLRYGTARDIPVDELGKLIDCIFVEVISGFRYACHQLDEDAAQQMRDLIRRFDRALDMAEPGHLEGQWHTALESVTEDDRAAPLIRGLVTRLLHNKQVFEIDRTANVLSRNLSQATPLFDASAWLEGFIDQSGEVFVHDEDLFVLVDEWLQSIDEESFIETLPTLRRSFADFDPIIRRRLLHKTKLKIKPNTTASRVQEDNTMSAEAFNAFLPLLNQLVDLPDE